MPYPLRAGGKKKSSKEPSPGTRVKIISPQDKNYFCMLLGKRRGRTPLWRPHPLLPLAISKTQLLIPEPLLAAQGHTSWAESGPFSEVWRGGWFTDSAHPGYLDYSHHILDCIRCQHAPFEPWRRTTSTKLFLRTGPIVWFHIMQAFRLKSPFVRARAEQADLFEVDPKDLNGNRYILSFPTEPTKSPSLCSRSP